MTANKPEVKRYDCTSGGDQHCYGCYTMKEGELGDYVEWEAYEALQAECEKLRKDAERYRWLRDGASMLTDMNPWEDVGFVGAVCVCTEYGSQTALTDEDLDAAIDAAMEQPSHDN